MECVAFIGRLNPGPALSIVCELLNGSLERFVALSRLPAVTEVQAATVNEELYWIVAFAGSVPPGVPPPCPPHTDTHRFAPFPFPCYTTPALWLSCPAPPPHRTGAGLWLGMGWVGWCSVFDDASLLLLLLLLVYGSHSGGAPAPPPAPGP